MGAGGSQGSCFTATGVPMPQHRGAQRAARMLHALPMLCPAGRLGCVLALLPATMAADLRSHVLPSPAARCSVIYEHGSGNSQQTRVLCRSYVNTSFAMHSALGVSMVRWRFQWTASLAARLLRAGPHHCSPHSMQSSVYSSSYQKSHSRFSDEYSFACWL